GRPTGGETPRAPSPAGRGMGPPLEGGPTGLAAGAPVAGGAPGGVGLLLLGHARGPGGRPAGQAALRGQPQGIGQPVRPEGRPGRLPGHLLSSIPAPRRPADRSTGGRGTIALRIERRSMTSVAGHSAMMKKSGILRRHHGSDTLEEGSFIDLGAMTFEDEAGALAGTKGTMRLAEILRFEDLHQ